MIAAASSNQVMTATALIGLLWMWRSSAKTIKMGGRRGLRPWPLRFLSQFLSERKERLLKGDEYVSCGDVYQNWRTFQ